MPSSSRPLAAREPSALTPREREILRLVVTSFVATAGPVGSQALVRRFGLGLSSASIRSTMSDLEDAGYLEHPHTSAGRVPTDRGYRAFVDELMQTPGLSPDERGLIRAELDRLVGGPDDLGRETSKLLGRLSNLLGVVLLPRFGGGVLDRVEAVPLSSERIMFVLSLRGGLVRTILLELDAAPGRSTLDAVVGALNERLAGLSLDEIRRTYAARTRDVDDRTGLVRLVFDRAPTVFADPPQERLRASGARHLLGQPEFREADDLRALVGLLEDEHFLVQLLDDPAAADAPGRAVVTIGREHGVPDPAAAWPAGRYSVVRAPYRVGDQVGVVGVVGPTRMDYARVVGLVEHLAAVLSGGASA